MDRGPAEIGAGRDGENQVSGLSFLQFLHAQMLTLWRSDLKHAVGRCSASDI